MMRFAETGCCITAPNVVAGALSRQITAQIAELKWTGG